MAALRTGLASQLTAPVAETTYGVAPSFAAAKFPAFKSETLAMPKTHVQGEGILSGKLYPQTARRVVTNWQAAGTVVMDLPARGLQQWLFPMFGSYGQTPAALTQDTPNPFSYTATSASPCVFTAAGSAYTNGTAVVLSGGTPPTGFTNGTTYYVVSASGTSFSLAATPGGTAINSSSTGNGTVSTATGAYKAVHAPGNLEGNSFALQKGVPTTDSGAVEPVTYVGCKLLDWELAVVTGQIAQLTLTLDARNELAGAGNSDPLNVSVPTLQAYVAPPAGSVFHFRQATLFSGGTPSTTSGVTTVSGATAVGNLLSAQVKHTVPLDVGRFYVGKGGFKDEQLQNGLRVIGGQFVIEWLSSEAMYNTFAADTATALQLQFLAGSIGTGSDFSTFTVLIPDVFLDAAPIPVAGLGPVQQTIPFTGLDDGTNNAIQATYWTLDAS